MRTTPLWHLLFGLFVNTHCLPDWNSDTQPGEVSASESLLGNAIENPSIALGTALSSEITKAEDISDCAPDTERVPSKRKARRDNICLTDPRQFNNGENGRQILPTATSGQQGSGELHSGGKGSGEPQVPILRFPSHDDPLQYILIPEKIRPRENEEVCPDMDYHVPVCAREADAYISSFPVAGDTILDPCHLCKIKFFIRLYQTFKLMQRCQLRR